MGGQRLNILNRLSRSRHPSYTGFEGGTVRGHSQRLLGVGVLQDLHTSHLTKTLLISRFVHFARFTFFLVFAFLNEQQTQQHTNIHHTG